MNILYIRILGKCAKKEIGFNDVLRQIKDKDLKLKAIIQTFCSFEI